MSVVVTGYGLCTSSGHAATDILKAVVGGTVKPGASNGRMPVRRVDDGSAVAWVPQRLRRKMDRLSRITTAAVAQALRHSGIDDPEMAQAMGLVLDTSFGSAGVVSKVLADVLSDDPVISPLLFPNVVANAAAGQAAISFGLRGPSSVLGGTGSLMYGLDLLRAGRAQRLVVGGFDEMTDVYERALESTGFPRIIRALGEGAAVVVLEREDAARERGAAPLAELVEASVATDLNFELDGASAYAGDGITRALESVLGCPPAPDAFIGSGWPGTLLREAEEQFVRSSDVARGTWPKDATGEMFACSAALNAVLAVSALSAADVGPRPRAVVVTGHDSTRGQSAAALFKAPSRRPS